jgi:16S rRNA processing protein RimM
VESPQAAALLRGKKLEIPERARKELPAGRYYHHDIIGLEVWTTSGTLLGKVSEVLSTGGNDIFVVKNSGKEVLIPAVKDVVKQIDVPNKRITIKEIEGLLG